MSVVLHRLMFCVPVVQMAYYYILCIPVSRWGIITRRRVGRVVSSVLTHSGPAPSIKSNRTPQRQGYLSTEGTGHGDL